MCEAPVLYATTEGQTERIARRIADGLRPAGLSSEAIDVGSDAAARIDWKQVRGALLGASLHAGSHQKRAREFAFANRDHLNGCPSWFFSVSLAIRSTNPKEVSEAHRLAQAFADASKWRPRNVACFAGRLAYTKYGWFIRWFMQRIARKEGGSTDTSRDHEYTDWAAVDAFAARCATEILSAPIAAPAA